MDVRVADSWTRPVPAADGVDSPFWAAAAEGRLVVQHCRDCGTRQFYPRALCVTCGGEPDWEDVSGRGVLHTFTIIRQNGAEPFKDELPYVVGIIELDEGPRLMGNVTGCPVDSVFIGMPLAAYAAKVEDDIGIVFWEPAETGR